MRRRYVVRAAELSWVNGSFTTRWCVFRSDDQVFMIRCYDNLWDAGAKMCKLNAREDQPI